MVIKTKSIFAAVDSEKDGTRVLITHGIPRPSHEAAIKISFDQFFAELSASTELMWKWRREEIDFDEFKRLFIEEIESNPAALTQIIKMARFMMLHSGHKRDKRESNITLLCACHSSAFWCHRLIVKELIEERNQRLRTTGKEEAKARKQRLTE